MSKSFRYTPDLRIRKPYKREPKLRTNVPQVPPILLEDEDTEPYTYYWEDDEYDPEED